MTSHVAPDPSRRTAAPWVRRMLLAAALAACVSAPGPAAAQRMAQPPNVGDAKRLATEYHASDAYTHDLAAVTAEAGAWLAQRAPQVRRPSLLVLDIDETALSN